MYVTNLENYCIYIYIYGNVGKNIAMTNVIVTITKNNDSSRKVLTSSHVIIKV